VSPRKALGMALARDGVGTVGFRMLRIVRFQRRLQRKQFGLDEVSLNVCQGYGFMEQLVKGSGSLAKIRHHAIRLHIMLLPKDCWELIDGSRLCAYNSIKI
jgi:hypothetical protein